MLTCTIRWRNLVLHTVSWFLLCQTSLSGLNVTMIFSCTHLYWHQLLVGLKLKGTKVPVIRKREKDSTSVLFVWTMDIIGIITRELDQKTLKLWKQSGNNLSSLLYHLCFSFVKYMILILFLFQGRTKEEGKKHQTSPKFHCAFRGRCTIDIHVFSSKVWYFFLSHMVILHFWWILSTN